MSQEVQFEAKRAMCVFAHPDDAEFGCAGTIARWVNEGLEVVYVLTTDGSKGSSDPNVSGEQLIQTRQNEQRDAAAELGVHEVEFLNHPDGYLEHTLELRRDIARMIRKHKPDRLISMTSTRSFTNSGYINHPDHIATGDATLAAVYPTARDRMTFPELITEGYEPHKVREVYVTGTETPDCWIDISETIDKKIAALYRHASQVSDPDLPKWIRERGAKVAEGQDMQYAECFKVFHLG